MSQRRGHISIALGKKKHQTSSWTTNRNNNFVLQIIHRSGVNRTINSSDRNWYLFESPKSQYIHAAMYQRRHTSSSAPKTMSNKIHSSSIIQPFQIPKVLGTEFRPIQGKSNTNTSFDQVQFETLKIESFWSVDSTRLIFLSSWKCSSLA